ncbi:alpha/beta hydrolase [Methylophaga thalassica]|uniref:alpha/beta hydrolase n=2 Tax=Methylophaga TaxID=40222 RepID=UPI002E7BE493|nr:alpha/beta hydrolase [Methylophaga thalassica]WVI86727.1 alpha/beta hydrolase [Methylophaga thalassica]
MMKLNILLGFFLLLMNGAVLSADNSIKMIRDLSYGDSPLQTMDIYLPANADKAPILFLIHGGAWQFGDKRATGLIKNKIDRWLKQGFIIVSANYRLVPEVDPVTQAQDLALALKTVQQQASAWGGDADKCILLGHSAGAHLLALLTTNQAFSQQNSLRRWLGSLIIDSQVLDLVWLMQHKHVEFYDKAFGGQAGYWQKASPINYVDANDLPMLIVCSLQRPYACDNSARFVDKVNDAGSKAELLKMDMTHNETLEEIGRDNAYTKSIEKFMSGLDPVVADHLSRPNDKK